MGHKVLKRRGANSLARNGWEIEGIIFGMFFCLLHFRRVFKFLNSVYIMAFVTLNTNVKSFQLAKDVAEWDNKFWKKERGKFISLK